MKKNLLLIFPVFLPADTPRGILEAIFTRRNKARYGKAQGKIYEFTPEKHKKHKKNYFTSSEVARFISGGGEAGESSKRITPDIIKNFILFLFYYFFSFLLLKFLSF